MTKKTILVVLLPAATAAFIFGGAWYFSNQVLYPSWKAPNLSVCTKNFIDEEWGPDCGNLRINKRYAFDEVTVQSENGRLSGWHVPAPSRDARRPAMFFLHGGGADRRQGYRFIEFFIKRSYDVYLFDLSEHGESEAKTGRLSLGEREYKDAIAVYDSIKKRHGTIIAMGTSMGAVSILNAVNNLPGISAIIVENPFYSPERFILETPKAAMLPRWIKSMIFRLICWRGGFEARHSPARSIKLQSIIPILFIHSKRDMVIPYQHSVELYQNYNGPKDILLTDDGLHAAILKSHKVLFFKTVDDFLSHRVR